MDVYTRHMPDIQGWLLRTAADIPAFFDWLDERLRAGKPIAIDTETTGERWHDYAFTRLVQFGDEISGWAVPVILWGGVIEEAMRRVVVAEVTVIFHNASYDMHALETMGYPVPEWRNVDDTMVLLHLRRSDLPKGLKSAQTAELLGPWVYAGKDGMNDALKDYGLKKGSDKWKWLPLEAPEYWAYAITDTVLTYRLWLALRPTAEEFAEQYDREMHFLHIMYRAESRGLVVDTGYAERLADEMAADIRRDLATLQMMGLDNPNSGDQLLTLLEEDFGFVPEIFTENGNPSLDKNVLAVLAKAGGMQAELVEVLIRYKRLVKWRSTYVMSALNEQDRFGRVHPSINTVGARTGRLAITGPPLQTIPGKQPLLRKLFKPYKGERWWSLDWSNQEPRTLAHYGRSPALLDYFNTGDGDGSIHDFVAGQLFGPTYTEEQRAVAKIFGLSRSYGAGPLKMSQASGADLAFVQSILPAYDDLMGLAELNETIGQAVADRTPPYLLTMGGRRVYVADHDEVYKLTNYLMQGSGADMAKMAAIEMDRQGLADLILVPVHDEYTFSLPTKEGPGLAEQLKGIMEGVGQDMAVRMPVDVDGPGRSWGALYEKEH